MLRLLLASLLSTTALAVPAQAAEPAATTTTVALERDVIVATVVAADGATPTGEVVFTDRGDEIGRSDLFVDGAGDVVAVLSGALAIGEEHAVRAEYLGSADHLGSTSTTVERRDPKLSVEVSSRRPASPFGWYRTPVRLRFTCILGTAPLVGGCLGSIRLTENQRGNVPISVGISAEDGGGDQLDVVGIAIDRTDPVLHVRGAEIGATYAHERKLRCAARDRQSGIWRCSISQDVRADRVLFHAVAVDHAGNRTTVDGSYFVR